ncbi:serine/threonine-protein kinase [Lysobacter sp. CFH 32150]|uniref:serine/threonine-protein kinase n=1 Tax=Lysobacter sp. CFH 32150 TaxID=2927128 RepID=UPI001FA73962|nr:serine/threonine-protein kinase [Lysobacter sp. CFH 32150]MCI4569220.1 serine/threonine-protein kinase [Lysobacter sp. CFH 32150]
MDAEHWQRLSPLLDALFELEPDERVRSLALMREEDPQLATELEALLQLELEREDFLSEPLVAPLPGPRPGIEVGPYRLDRMLGEGGMGQVWLAARSDGLYQRRVALKLLRPGLADPNLRLRFTRERQILARLAHPHIARLLDAGVSTDHQPYLALEYVEGEPVTDYCRNRKVSLEARLALFHQVCAAVSHAHANLIVHRDLKPSNILVTPAGEVRLLDFGIAKLIDTELAAPDQTRTGVRAFTLHYAAPEQVRGEVVTTMTDVYALGVVLYELLTDAKPYRLKRQTDAEWEEAILLVDPLKPSQTLQRAADDTVGPEAAALKRRARIIAGDLDNIVLKTLAKRPEQRYPSVEALALDLQRYQAGRPVQARPQSVSYRLRKYLQRHRWAIGMAVLVTAVLSTALAIVAWQARQAVQEAARAQAMQAFVASLFEGAGNASGGAPMDLRDLLDAGIVRADRELGRQPRARAEIYGVIARIRHGLGDYREAQDLLQRQTGIVATLTDLPPSLRLESATQRGATQLALNQHQACVNGMQPLLDNAQREQAQLPVQVANFYSQLGRCRRANGERNTARLLFERSLALRKDPLGDDVGVIENLFDLANLHGDSGDSAAAMRGYRGALAQLRQEVGERHPLAIELQQRIGMLQREQSNIAAAGEAFDAALSLSAELLGERHPTTLELRRQRGGVYMEQGWFDAAERELESANRQLVERLGDKHADVGRSFHTLGMVAWERGELQAAQRDMKRAVTIWRATHSRELLARGLVDYAQLLHAQGRQREAMTLIAEARDLRVQLVGKDHQRVGDIDRIYGELLAADGHHAEALERLTQALRLTRDGYGPAHVRTHVAELALAREQARENVAALARIEAIAVLPGKGNETDRLRWQARAYLAEARCRNGLAVQARSELDALEAELRVALPEGGRLPREVAAIRDACRVLAKR